MEKSPAQKIIEKIKQEKIVPESKFFLNWKSYLFWFIWLATLFLGAIFFSFIILNLLDIHPRVIRHLGLGQIFFVLAKTAPYLWITLALLAGISGFMAIKKTKHGYRYSILFVTSIGVLIVSMLGAFLHLAKINRHMGDKMFQIHPMSRGIAFPVEKRWKSPERGMLGGEVVNIEADVFKLNDFNNNTWEVYYSNDTKFRVKNFKTMMMVEVIGEKMGERKFKAFFVQPFPFDGVPGRRE